MAEGVGGDGFIEFGQAGGIFDGALEDAFVEMVAHGLFGLGVQRALAGWEDVLPAWFAIGVWVFSGKGVGEADFAEAFFEVALVDGFYLLDVGFEGGSETFGEGYGAVVFALAVADDDLAVGEVYVFDAEAHTFHEAEARAEEELGHEFGDAVHFGDDFEGFFSGEDGWEAVGFFGADEVGGEFDFLEEDVAVEKEDGAEGLILGGGGDIGFGGEVGDVGLNFGDAHFFGMAFVVVEDVAATPFDVGLFGAVGVMLGANGVAELFEEFFPLRRGGCLFWRRWGHFGGILGF